MKILLTDRYLKSRKPAATGKRPITWDAKLANFGVRITDRGVISFIVMRRLPGKKQPAKVTLGNYPGTSLAKARELAGVVLHDLASGVHPRERAAAEAREAEERRRAEAEAQANTFANLAALYIDRRASKKRTANAIAKLIHRHLLPRWGERLACDIKRREIIEMVEDIGKQSGVYAAKQAHTYASSIFNFGLVREYGGLQSNPAHLVKVRELLTGIEARQNVLTDAEIRAVWNAACTLRYPAGPFVRMLLLTGQRRSEVAAMKWSEVDIDAALWTIPAGRMKSNAEHTVPLSSPAVDLLRSLPRFTGDYVFTTNGGDGHIKGFAQSKDAIEHQVIKSGSAIPHWRFHDVRRTVRTQMSALGVAPFIAELVIGHRQQGVHRVYDVHRYDAEKRDALDRWAAKLRTIIEPPPANVLDLRSKRRHGG